ncbi:MAG: hypothetical protein WCP70_02045 [Methanothrix sp.]
MFRCNCIFCSNRMARTLIRPDGGASAQAFAGQRNGEYARHRGKGRKVAMKAPSGFCGFLSRCQG